jgi:hypothetical protein
MVWYEQDTKSGKAVWLENSQIPFSTETAGKISLVAKHYERAQIKWGLYYLKTENIAGKTLREAQSVPACEHSIVYRPKGKSGKEI